MAIKEVAPSAATVAIRNAHRNARAAYLSTAVGLREAIKGLTPDDLKGRCEYRLTVALGKLYDAVEELGQAREWSEWDDKREAEKRRG